MAQEESTEQRLAKLREELREARIREEKLAKLREELSQAKALEAGTPSPTPSPEPSAVPVAPEAGLMEQGADISGMLFRKATTGAVPPLEPLYFQPIDAGMHIMNLVKEGKYDDAKGLIEQAKEGAALGYIRQKKLEAESPILSETAGMLGAGIPMVGPAGAGASAAEKLIRGGMRAIPQLGTEIGAAQTFPQALGKIATTGLKAGALMSVGEEAGRATAEAAGAKGAQGTSADIATRVGLGTALPAVAGPALATGAAGVMLGKKMLQEWSLGPAGQRTIQMLFGVPPQTQKAYLANRELVESIPKNESIVAGIEDIRKKLETDTKLTASELQTASNAAEKFKKEMDLVVAETEGAHKRELQAANEQLALLRENLRLKRTRIAREELPEQKQALLEERVRPAEKQAERMETKFRYEKENLLGEMKKEAQRETTKLREDVRTFSAGKYVKEIEDAVDQIKAKSSEASELAISELSDDEFIDKGFILGAIQGEIKKAMAGGAATPGAKANLNMLTGMFRAVEESPENRWLGTKVKSFIQNIQEDLEPSQRVKYSTSARRALDSIRYQVSEHLKQTFPEYAEKMKDVSPLVKFVNEVAAKEFSTPRKIESAIESASTNPRIKDFFVKLEEFSGRPISDILSEFYVAQEAAKPGQLQAAIERLPSVIKLNRLRNDLRNTLDPRAQARIRAEIPFAEEAAAAEIELAQAKDPKVIKELEAQLPAMKALRETEAMIDIAQSLDFNAAIMRSIGVLDPQAAQAIIDLRTKAIELANPEFMRKRVQFETLKKGGDLAEAALAVIAKTEKLEVLAKAYDPFKSKETGETIVQSILRAPDGPLSDQGVRMARALSEMPIEGFEDFFKSIGLTDQKQARKLFEAMKIRQGFDVSRVRGSRSVQLFSKAVNGLVRIIRLDSPTSSEGAKWLGDLLKSMGPFIGAQIDTTGGSVAKFFLKRMADMRGVYTFEKFMRAVPESSRLSIQIGEFISRMADEVRQQAVNEVSAANIPSVVDDIMSSSLSPVKKARASLQVKNGFIEGELLADLMESGMPKASRPLAARMVRFTE